MNKTTSSNMYMSDPGFMTAARAALVLVILCGGLYPALTTLIGGLLFPHQATGSLIYRDGQAVGSELVGQAFSSEHYFYGRPSAAGYNPSSVSGSNLAPSNPALSERAAVDSQRIQQTERTTADRIPVDLISASGSGIDPHITPESALLQAARVASARGMTVDALNQIINEHIESAQWGVFGQPRINVLELNLALDEF